MKLFSGLLLLFSSALFFSSKEGAFSAPVTVIGGGGISSSSSNSFTADQTFTTITVTGAIHLGATNTTTAPVMYVRGPNASVGDVRTGFIQMKDNGDTGNNFTLICNQGSNTDDDDCNFRLQTSSHSHTGINFGGTPSSAFTFNADALADASFWLRSRAAQTGSGPLQRTEMTQQTAGFTINSRTGGIYPFPGTSAGTANVGVATQSPTAKLHVVTGTTGNGTKLSDAYTIAQLQASTPTVTGATVYDSTNFDLWVGSCTTNAGVCWRNSRTAAAP